MKITLRNLFEKNAFMSITGPIAAGFLVAVGALVAIVWMSAHALDASEIEKEEFVANGIIDRLKDGVGYTVLPQANWDDAYLMFQAPLDLDRVRSQIGPDALRVLDLEGLYVFDAINRPIYSIYEDVEYVNAVPPSQAKMKAFAEVVRRKLADRPSDFVSGVVNEHGVLHVIAGAFLAPTTETLRQRALDGRIMIVEREVPWENLQMLGRAFALDDFDQSVGASAVGLTLHDPMGNAVATLSWTPKRQGQAALRQALPPIIIVMLMLCMFSAHVLSNWLKMERELKESRVRSAALEEADRTKSVLLSHLSHELRTPLNAIIGFAQLMKHGLLSCDRHGDYARDIETGGRRLLGVVESVLELARLERGEFKPDLDEIDLNLVLEEAVACMRERADEAQVGIETAEGPIPLVLVSDAQAVGKVLVHLLDNAIKFSPAGARVKILTRSGTDGVAVTVEDQGPGMSPELCARAMTPLAAAEDAFIQRGQGIGVGLALSRALVRHLNAKLEIASAIGEGTRVSLVFPADAVPAGVPVVKSRAA